MGVFHSEVCKNILFTQNTDKIHLSKDWIGNRKVLTLDGQTTKAPNFAADETCFCIFVILSIYLSDQLVLEPFYTSLLSD